MPVLLTDHDCAVLVDALYNDQLNKFDYVSSISGTKFAVQYTNQVVVFEGSRNIFTKGGFRDWRNDFNAVMIRPPGLMGAGVHAGAYTGLPGVMTLVSPRFSKVLPVYVIGHSLGAMRACQFAAMMKAAGYNVICITWGLPRPGDDKLARILADCVIRSYWNYHTELAHDPVGDVPVDILPFFNFIIPCERIKICVEPEPTDPWGDDIISYHYFPHYLKGTPS